MDYKKEFEYLKNILEKSGEHLYREKRATVYFIGEYPNGFVDMEISSGRDSQIMQKDHRTKTENIIPAPGVSFKNLVWKEGKYYVSQCLNVDISSFGKTKKEASQNAASDMLKLLKDTKK